jgi:hypothetical protein
MAAEHAEQRHIANEPHIDAALRCSYVCPVRFGLLSKTDGIVAWEGCVSTASTNHRNIEVVDVSHLDMVRHPEVLRVVADLLAQHRGGAGQAVVLAAGR